MLGLNFYNGCERPIVQLHKRYKPNYGTTKWAVLRGLTVNAIVNILSLLVNFLSLMLQYMLLDHPPMFTMEAGIGHLRKPKEKEAARNACLFSLPVLCTPKS